MRIHSYLLLLGLSACINRDPLNNRSEKDYEIDEDGDGVSRAEDCDDEDPLLGAFEDDNDCDGYRTDEDCDDYFASSTHIAEDADCDGTVTEADCDDNDASLEDRRFDQDCDGVPQTDDCDDEDVSVGDKALDADCDGSPTADDCDDNDPTVGDVARDTDCDGVIDPTWSSVNGLITAADYTFVGEAASDYFGIQVASAGDVDGDGLADFMMAAPLNSSSAYFAGRSYLFLGASLGTTSSINLTLADHTFIGAEENDQSGFSLSSAGDVDGDGLDDILVGSAPVGSSGKTYLVLGASLGASRTIDLSTADYIFVGQDGERSAWAVSSAGDVDGDGLDDILVGAERNSENGTNAGKVYLILGASLGTSGTIDLSLADYAFLGEAPEDMTATVASAGDVDGDGLDDILVGSFANDSVDRDSGKAYLFLGASLSTSGTFDLSSADYSFIGEGLFHYAGYSVSSAGDVDGDGLDDLLVGAVYNAEAGLNAGKTYLILGASLGTPGAIDLSSADYSFIGEAEEDQAGSAVASAGDVDGDGLADILVSASGNSEGGNRAGKTYLILGSSLGSTSSTSLSSADYAFIGEADGDRSGSSIATAGDVNGDGLDDFLVGAWFNDEGGVDAGKAYLILSSFTPPAP